MVVEEEGVLRCVRCGASVSLTEAPTLAGMRCNDDRNNEVLKCQACRRPATQKLPLINFKGEFEDFNTCDACANDYLRLLRQGPSLGHGKGRLPPDSYYFDSLRTVFQRLGGVFPCPACDEVCENLYDAVKHFYDKHHDKPSLVEIEIDGIPALKTWQYIWCRRCLRWFENERHFRSHLGDHR